MTTPSLNPRSPFDFTTKNTSYRINGRVTIGDSPAMGESPTYTTVLNGKTYMTDIKDFSTDFQGTPQHQPRIVLAYHPNYQENWLGPSGGADQVLTLTDVGNGVLAPTWQDNAPGGGSTECNAIVSKTLNGNLNVTNSVTPVKVPFILYGGEPGEVHIGTGITQSAIGEFTITVDGIYDIQAQITYSNPSTLGANMGNRTIIISNDQGGSLNQILARKTVQPSSSYDIPTRLNIAHHTYIEQPAKIVIYTSQDSSVATNLTVLNDSDLGTFLSINQECSGGTINTGIV